MQKNDLKLIAEFLEEYYQSFQDFLDDKEIEPSEAEPIIDDLKEEINRTQVLQTSADKKKEG